jgi:hypothetical protein
MRTTSTFLGLTLLALTGSARAEEGTPVTAETAPTAAETTAATGQAAPVADAPMVASQADAPAASGRKLQVGLSFLPMGLGKWVYRPDAKADLVKSDAYVGYGVGVSVAYEVLPHLLVGLAPQIIYNVQEKTPQFWAKPVSEWDLMARIAYSYPIVETINLYAEVLPGYSLIRSEAGSAGLVLAFGAGVAMDLTDRVFINIGGGYQIGFQKNGDSSLESQTRYVRFALGAGMKF